MHLHVILCYCSAAQQQGCDSYSSSSGGGSTIFIKSDFSSTVAVEHYRKHLKNSRKKNKQTKTGTITRKTLENVSIKVICINTPSSLV